MTIKISNMSGVEVDEKELREMINVIRKLPLLEIDNFFYSQGWIDSEADEGRALPDWRLEKIKKDEKFADNLLNTLFQESYKNDFLKKFNEIKKKWKQ